MCVSPGRVPPDPDSAPGVCGNERNIRVKFQRPYVDSVGNRFR